MVAVIVVSSMTCTPPNETSIGAMRLAPVTKPEPLSVTCCALPRAATAGSIPVRVGPGTTVKQPVQTPRPSSGLVTRMSHGPRVATSYTVTVSSRVVDET